MIGSVMYHVLKDPTDGTIIPLAIIFPNGECSVTNEKDIDLSPAAKYIGWPIKIFSNDVLMGIYIISNYQVDENGVGCLYYEL